MTTNITFKLSKIFMGLTMSFQHLVRHGFVSTPTLQHVAVDTVNSPKVSGTVSPLYELLITFFAHEI